MKKIIYLCGAVLPPLLLAAGCSPGNVAKTAAPVPVLVATAVAKTVPVLISPPPVGHVTPVLSVTIRPQIGGVISTVDFPEGREVRSGDLLFTIDPRPAQAALTLARGSLSRDSAQLENARIQLERDRRLFEQKLISPDQFDTTKVAVDALVGTVAADRAAVTNAELNLQYCEIRAPIDGRTGGLSFHAGNVVKAPDDVLLTINQIHPIYAAFAVPERYLPEIQKQMRRRTLAVSAAFENLVGEPPQGELSFVDNSVDATTGTILLKATFPNTDGRLWPGQYVQLALQLDELDQAVVVPSQAVQNGQGGQFIFVVKPDQTVEQREVKTSVTFKGETVIASGLRVGETVVTDGQLRLAPGVAVSVKSQ
ncbi:MAG: efflux RND transporter periplasmic adaptor subunit [Verrucomicrobiota bacterium]